MTDPNEITDLIIACGLRGHGKTQYIVDHLEPGRPVLALDFRGQISEKTGVPVIRNREDFMHAVLNREMMVLYQPGFDPEDYEVYDDIEYFLEVVRYYQGSQVVIDEIDYELKPTEYPAAFRKLISSSRTERISIFITAHSVYECPRKLRGQGKFVCFRLTDERDLQYLGNLGDRETLEKIRVLPKYQFIILPTE